MLATGAAAVLSGRPFLFPNIGPSAYVLVTDPTAKTAAPRRVLGGHAIGVCAGLVVHGAFAPGLVVIRERAALSPAVGRLAVAAALAAAMRATDLRHAPACATTLIVALGFMSTPTDGVVMMLAVGSVARGAAGTRGRGSAPDGVTRQTNRFAAPNSTMTPSTSQVLVTTGSTTSSGSRPNRYAP